MRSNERQICIPQIVSDAHGRQHDRLESFANPMVKLDVAVHMNRNFCNRNFCGDAARFRWQQTHLAFNVKLGDATFEKDVQRIFLDLPARLNRSALKKRAPRPERWKQHHRSSPAARPASQAQVAAFQMQGGDLRKSSTLAVMNGEDSPVLRDLPLLLCHGQDSFDGFFRQRQNSAQQAATPGAS